MQYRRIVNRLLGADSLWLLHVSSAIRVTTVSLRGMKRGNTKVTVVMVVVVVVAAAVVAPAVAALFSGVQEDGQQQQCHDRTRVVVSFTVFAGVLPLS